MARTVSAAEAKNRFGAIMQAARDGDEIIIARHGKGDVAVVSANDLEELHVLRAKERRRNALERLHKLERDISEANRDLDMSDEEIEALAEEISREALQRLVGRGEITFERNSN